MNDLLSTLTTSLCIRYLSKRQSAEIFLGHKFSCDVSSNIFVFSRFVMVFLMITDVLYFTDTDVFVKIMFFFTLEEQEAVEQFLLNVLFIVVINCFLEIRFSQLYCFS